MATIGNFDESRPEFKGFNAFYNEKIGPYLEGRETERKRRVKQAIMLGLGIVLTGFSLSGFLYTKGADVIWLVAPSVAGLIFGGTGMSVWANLMSDEIKLHVMKNICGFIGWEYSEKQFVAPDLKPLQENALLPKKVDRSSFEDQMIGNAHGADFKFCEAHLETESRDKDGHTQWNTVFRGVLLQIDFHREFLGRTVVLRDAGFFNAKKKAGMKRVGLVDPVFEKIFEAYSTDQVESRYLLTPDFMQKLVDLENIVSGKKIRFGFFDEKLHIAIEAPNQFEVGSLFKTLVGTKRTEKLLSEFNAIFEIVDGVAKPQNRV